MDDNLYKKSIKFRATRYEEWMFGSKISQGPIDAIIDGVAGQDGIVFSVQVSDALRMHPRCRCAYALSTVLPGRIQYVSAIDGMEYPNIPVQVHLFPEGDGTIKYVRFAMTNPDRIIEFYGFQQVAVPYIG